MAKKPHASCSRSLAGCSTDDQSRILRTGSNSTTRTKCGCCFLAVVFYLAAGSIVPLSDAGISCLSNPCVYGVCIDDLNSTYSCYCIDGYTGVHCQTNWDECWSSPCLNSGTCIDGVASYNCTCADGFLGLNCEENFNECQSNPCQNGGICHDKENAFYCSCAQGYEGDFCENDVAVCDTGHRCHNGAVCIEGPGLEYSCQCTAGYEGRMCDAEINECASGPCQNGAICIDQFASYVCACAMGFSGTNCEEEIMICADSPCANQALCLMEDESPTCYCVPDFHGERCELQYDECQLEPERCTNGGTCVDGVDEYFCTCAPQFSGESCECLILEQEDRRISMDCNYTIPFDNGTVVENTFPTTEETMFSTTENAFYSSIGTDERSESPQYPQTDSTPLVHASTDSHVQFPGNTSLTTDKAVNLGDILSTTTPASASQPTTSILDESATDSSSFYGTTSRDRESEPPVSISDKGEAQNLTTIETSAVTIEGRTEGGNLGTTIDYFSSVDSATKLTLSTVFEDGSPSATPSFHSEPLTTSYTDAPNVSELPPGTVATFTPESSSFFTESPKAKTTSFQPPTQGEGQFTTSALFSSSVDVGVEQTAITTRSSVLTTRVVDGTTEAPGMGPVGTTPATPAMTRGPDVIQECDDTVCANGGTCAMTANGVRCHCDFRYGGPFCDVRVSIKNAAFSKDSFLRHIIYRRQKAQVEAPAKPNFYHEQLAAITVRFKAKLTSRDGLILLATAEGDEGNHYVALFLHNGLLQFQFSCGLQTMLLSEIEGTVNNGFELKFKVQLNFNEKYSHCNASLHVNETLAMSGEQPTWFINVANRLQQGYAGALASIRESWLHLGGRPIKTIYTLSHNISRFHGFTGCIYDLEINNIAVAIFNNAEDANKIYECTSLACLSSPCRNGAVCVEDESNGVDRRLGMAHRGGATGTWSCKCAFGYMGKICERSICDNNPCQFGGTCVTFPESGYLCLCPYGKHGHFCEHDLDILQPSFFGSINGISSYVAYPIAFPLEDRFEFSFKIIPTTMSQISLLAFIGQPSDHNEQSDHFSVSFIQGFILVTWNLGSGPRRIFTQQPIQVQSARPTTINVGRNGRTTWLSIDGKVNISGNSPGANSKLNVASQLFIGGHERVNFSTLPHDLPLHSGFQGCLFDIRLLAGPLNIPLQHIGGMRGRSVGQCGTKECHRHACQNNGACLQHGSTFTCLCQEDWNGILCSKKVNPCDESISKCAGPGAVCFPLISGYECDCSFGKVGKRCEANLKYLSDVSFSGRRSYLALRWPSHRMSQAEQHRHEVQHEKIVHHSHFTPHNHSILLKSIRELDKINDVLKVLPSSNTTETYGHVQIQRSENYRQLKIRQISIELQLRPLSEKGLIMFVRTFDSNAQQQGFISVSLQGGVVEYRVSSAHLQVSVVRSNHVLAIGEWHTIRIVKFGKRLTLWVDGKGTSTVGSVREEYISLDSEMYLGGLPDLSNLPYEAISGYPLPYRGCIRGVSLNETRITLNDSLIVASRNINDCDGTPCGGDMCARGGQCWLDEHYQPHCKCPEHSRGASCEIQESCEVVQCHNNGQCMKDGQCSCGVGWTGNYCEIATTKYSSIGFNDRSYILIPSQKIKMKDKRNDGSGILEGKSWLELQLSFNFSTLEDGLLLWTMATEERYVGIGIRDGFLVVASNMFVDKDVVSKDSVQGAPWKAFVADGDWHNVLLETKANHFQISVDGNILFRGLNQASSPLNQRHTYEKSAWLDEMTYLGGFPDENIYNRTGGSFAKSFNGCIQHIYLGNQLDEVDITAYEGANINECLV